MHILIAIVGALGAGLFWWYRLRAAGDAAREITNLAGKTRGAVIRRNFRNKAARSPYTAIDDPVIGAATLIIAMANELGGFDPDAESRLRRELAPAATGPDLIDEAVIYGKWAAAQSVEASTPLRLIAPFLNETLTVGEREQLVAIAERVVGPIGGEKRARTDMFRMLGNRLGLASA